MKNSRDTYIRKSLAKLTHKSWEHYVVNRLVHRLDDPEIEFICQQHVPANGSRYLSDVYFPQFDLHLEVDERAHFGNEAKDAARAISIENTTSHKLTRIRVHEEKQDISLAAINAQIEVLIGELRCLKSEKLNQGVFSAWPADNEDRPQDYYEKGYISADENALFRTKTAALRCFGFGKKSLQQASWRVKERPGYCVWLPRFVNQGEWTNTLSDDGKEIIEEHSSGKTKVKVEKELPFRYVFGKIDDVLKNTFFKFLGEYHIDLSVSTDVRRVYNLRATSVKTVSPHGKHDPNKPYDPNEKFGGPVFPAFSAAVTKMIEAGELTPKF